MKRLLLSFFSLAIFSAGIGQAASVQYVFTATNPTANNRVDFSFSLLTPSHFVADQSYAFTADQLTTSYINRPLGKITGLDGLTQATRLVADSTFTVVLLHLIWQEDSGASPPEKVLQTEDTDFTATNGPGQPNLYLDRDGSYSVPILNSSRGFGDHDILTFSVQTVPDTPVPEPSNYVFGGLSLAMLVFARKRLLAR
jgi:hypothetical protein